jgi:hypothetical protein
MFGEGTLGFYASKNMVKKVRTGTGTTTAGAVITAVNPTFTTFTTAAHGKRAAYMFPAATTSRVTFAGCSHDTKQLLSKLHTTMLVNVGTNNNLLCVFGGTALHCLAV